MIRDFDIFDASDIALQHVTGDFFLTGWGGVKKIPSQRECGFTFIF
jgi:hypothetical protein